MVHTFSGNLLDRTAQLRLDQNWLEAQRRSPSCRYVLYAADRPLIWTNARSAPFGIYWPRELAEQWCELETATLLLGLDGEDNPVFAGTVAVGDDGRPSAAPPDEVKPIDLRSLAAQGVLVNEDLSVLAQARSLLHWHQTHRFCGACGATTEPEEAGYKRICSGCGREHFPRTDPVVIMVATHGERCLLGRQPQFVQEVYSALAGFLEPGESIEEAARREIREEAGIEIGQVHYHSSQPWPFPMTLMIGLLGEALNDDVTIDPNELEDARWFSRDEIRQMMAGTHEQGLKVPQPFAIAHHLVKAFAQEG